MMGGMGGVDSKKYVQWLSQSDLKMHVPRTRGRGWRFRCAVKTIKRELAKSEDMDVGITVTPTDDPDENNVSAVTILHGFGI